MAKPKQALGPLDSTIFTVPSMVPEVAFAVAAEPAEQHAAAGSAAVDGEQAAEAFGLAGIYLPARPIDAAIVGAEAARVVAPLGYAPKSDHAARFPAGGA